MRAPKGRSGPPLDPEFERFQRDVRTKLIPRMRDGAVVTMIAPDISAEFDVYFALQVGAALVLEKPIVLIADRSRTLSPKLERLADRIINVDFADPDWAEKSREELEQFFKDFGKQ